MNGIHEQCISDKILWYFSDDAKVAKRKLQMLSNHVFEELTMDVYDEVDRRETDAIWNALHGKVRKEN